MKVLQINSVCGIGSTGRIATDIHNILTKQGHVSYIAYGRDFPKNCDAALRIGNKLDNYTHVAITRIFDNHGFGSKYATMKFIQEVMEIDPDIIHLHNLHGYYLNVEILFNYLKEANKPIIWTLHDCWAFTGHCSYFDYVGCDKWKTGCFKCPEKNAYPCSLGLDNSKGNYIRKREIFTGLKTMTIVTPSEWLANLVKKSYLGEYPVKVINNGIDLNVFKPLQNTFKVKYNLMHKFIILGVASTWDRRKGLKYFIELSGKLTKDEVIVLVGLSEKQLKEIPQNIIGISRTDNVQELADIYSSADVFVNPTLEDNFPTTNLEALACGTPVITFDTGGSPESIDSESGIIVEIKNIEELRNEILCVKNDRYFLDKNNIAKKARQFFDKNERYNDYIELYNKISKKCFDSWNEGEK